MKTRIDFVTNSSSSSFIALKKGDYNTSYDTSNYIYSSKYPLFEKGETEFGWSQELYSDIESKMNWVLLQIAEMKDDWKSILFSESEKKQIKENYNNYKETVTEIFRDELDIEIDWEKVRQAVQEDAYIDHQSTITEDSDIDDFFKSRENIMMFIFNPDSILITGNDNCDERGCFGGLEKPYINNDNYITY